MPEPLQVLKKCDKSYWASCSIYSDVTHVVRIFNLFNLHKTAKVGVIIPILPTSEIEVQKT